MPVDQDLKTYLHKIPTSQVSTLGLPDHFTYPFNYRPHPITIYATKTVQAKLSQLDFLEGKMFGVLVVQLLDGEIGFLQAFSGKWMGKTQVSGFVPPVFDWLEEHGFFKKGENELDELNVQIHKLENDNAYLIAKERLKILIANAEQEKNSLKAELKANKIIRKKKRETAANQDFQKYQLLTNSLDEESRKEKSYYRKITKENQTAIDQAQEHLTSLSLPIEALKEERKILSNKLQKKLFDQYNFLNIKGETSNVRTLFKDSLNGKPPAAAGDCAAPKLLQFAFKHQLRPICMAEFWWGPTSATRIRKQGNYYPACRGKCEPILSHMLEGLHLDENPLLRKLVKTDHLDIIYEDKDLLAINKPANYLSVPGKMIKDSVYEWVKNQYPKATGPLIVHRLDMATSGLLLIAKSKEIHQLLQAQFIKRKIKKKYKAILNGVLSKSSGEIQLPLRVDLDDRPRQMVCYEHGKSATTRWELIENKNQEALVNFFPITGRTHQLRVHAAHPKGIAIPIKGDELYGKPADRLYLHAEELQFWHPGQKKQLTLTAPAPF